MKEKILAFLKTKIQGVSEAYLLGVADLYSKTVTEETQIESTFTDGVIDLLKLSAAQLQSEGDRRATEAQKTALKNFLEKHNLDENGKPKGTPPPPGDVPEWFKAYQEEHTQLKTKLDGFEKEKTVSQLKATLVAKLKEKGIPDSYIKGRNLAIEKEEDIDQLVTSIDTDYTTFRQELVEQGVIISVPRAAEGSVKEGEVLGKTIAEKRNANSSEGVEGKKV